MLFIEEQQKRIDELEKQLDEAIEVIRFYADKENWKKNHQVLWTLICKKDREKIKHNFWVGGKKAREYMSKWGVE